MSISQRSTAARLGLVVLLVTPFSVQAAPPAGFSDRVEAVRKDAGVPGIAIAIVEQGQPTLVQGFGVRALKDPRKVDDHTIFMTGSTGKAITVAALAILVDEGKIGWDDKVIDHIPWFRMYDSYATREMTIRDLLVHRSGLGLGAGDLLAVPRGSLSRKETVKRIASIKPAYGFREKYEYDNVLYSVAGQLIEEVTGQTWEQFVRERIFRAGGMMDSTTDNAGRFASPNRALPHARLGAPVRGAGTQQTIDERDEPGENMAPAGMQAMSAADLSRWIAIQLGHGSIPGGGRLWSEAQATEMWKPVVIQDLAPVPDWMKPIAPKFDTYALAWDVRDYHGAKLIWHSGGVFGYGAVVVLLPEQNVGFAIATNSEDGYITRGLMYELIDHYVGRPHTDWVTPYTRFYKDRLTGAMDVLAKHKLATADVGPSLPLANYVGTYRDAWYGNVTISQKNGGLWINFTNTPRMEGPITHTQYDTFVSSFTDPAIENALVTFQLDGDGKVDRIKMAAASPIADFSYDYRDLDLRPVRGGK